MEINNEKLFINNEGTPVLIKIKDIHAVTCKGNYIKIMYGNNESPEILGSLNKIKQILNAYSFFRVSRNELINTNYIDVFNSKTRRLILKNQTQTIISRRQAVELMILMKLAAINTKDKIIIKQIMK